jgi:hypothetical protein
MPVPPCVRLLARLLASAPHRRQCIDARAARARIPPHALAARHAVVPRLDVCADQVEDAAERRDEQVADIVLCVNPQGGVGQHLGRHARAVDQAAPLGVGDDVRHALGVLRFVARVLEDAAVGYCGAGGRDAFLAAV